MRLTFCLILIFVLTSCSFEDINEGGIDFPIKINPLDSILGDKVINDEPREIRLNNFQDFYEITREDLGLTSKLYSITEIGSDCYLINQKKKYSEARNFTVLVKVNDKKISKYQVVNDFQTIDFINDNSGFSILLGNFGLYNEYWKPNNQIKVINFDFDLTEIWSYTSTSDDFPIEGLEIDHHAVKVNVITGCHICTNTFELKLNQSGKCISASQIYSTNSSTIFTKEMSSNIFGNKSE